MNAHAVPTDPADLVGIVRKEAEMFARAAEEKRMRIVLNIHDNMPMVKGETNELKQVVHNLISNAIKYGHVDTEVTVSLKITSELPQDWNMRNLTRVAMLSVRDRGEGIAKQHLPRLTERFYRVDSARTREVGGTGLGLAIVKGIVVRHRGAITVDSVVGEGTCFTVYLPIFEN
jgi:two-component system phosphate regulon sensor histidine kinase PhoR